jgi:hypothetical protein
MKFPIFFLSACFAVQTILPVEAVEFSVQERESVSILTRSNVAVLRGDSLGSLTDRILSEAARREGLDYEGNDGGVIRIAGLGNAISVISDTEMKAYGWCFRLNGEVPELMANEVTDLGETDVVEWYYAYAHYRGGEWIAQCRPLGDEPLPPVSDSK